MTGRPDGQAGKRAGQAGGDGGNGQETAAGQGHGLSLGRTRQGAQAVFEIGVVGGVGWTGLLGRQDQVVGNIGQAHHGAAFLRGKGIGKALLKHLAERCVREGLGRFEWWVLDWNEPSIQFYKSQGGVMQDEWTKVRIEGPALAKLGQLDAL